MPPRKPNKEVFQLWKIKKRRHPLTISRSKSGSVGMKIIRLKCSCCGKYSIPRKIPKNVKFHSPPLANPKGPVLHSDLAQERQRKLRCTRHATPHPMPRITNIISTTPRRYDTISSTRNRIRKYVISKKNKKPKYVSPNSSSPSDVSSMDISLDSSEMDNSSQTSEAGLSSDTSFGSTD